jgi:hypothetical protein
VAEAAELAFGAPEAVLEPLLDAGAFEPVPAAGLAAAPLAVFPAGAELAAGADGEAGVAGLAASGVDGVVTDESAPGVDVSFGAGAPASVLSAFVDEASLEEPPEQADPNTARALNNAR